MEGDHHEAAGRLQDSLRRGERLRKLGQFLIDEDAECLERPGRRMNLVRLGADHAPDDVGQCPSGVDRSILAGGDDGAGDAAGVPLLAELEDDVGEVALGGLRHHIGGARSFAPHPHVERAVEPEREAALGLIELHRGHAKIEDDAVDRRMAEFFRDAVERREAFFDQRQSAIGLLDQSRAIRYRALVAVDADHLRVGGRQDGAAVAAVAEGAVDINPTVARIEKLKRLASKHGNMTSQSASDSSAIAARHYSRAPSGSSAAPSEPGRLKAAHAVAVASMTRAPRRTGSKLCNIR